MRKDNEAVTYLKAVRSEFVRTYGGRIGRIEGGSQSLVMLQMYALSTNASDDYLRTAGCQPGELALLIGYITEEAYRHCVKRATGKLPLKSKACDRVVFPKRFNGVSVYYTRGKPIVPLSE